MSIEDLGSLGEFVGAIAVVLSLLYLATQIRQNTHATRASAYEDVAQGMRAFMALIAEDRDLAHVYLQGSAGLDHLSPEDQVRFAMLPGHFFANFDMTVDLYRRRMIDDKMMAPYTRFAESVLAQPGVAEWWKDSQQFFSDDLRSHVEASATIAAR